MTTVLCLPATGLRLITAAEARGQQRLAEGNRHVLHNDPKPGKAKHAG